MKSKLFIITSIITLFLVTSCTSLECGGTKENFLSDFKSFVEEANPKSEDDNKKLDAKFEKYIEECYNHWKDDMSSEEKVEFWGTATAYYAKRFGSGLESIINKIGDLFEKDISKGLESLFKTIETEGEKISDKLEKKIESGEIEELFKNVEGDIKKWGEEINKILEE